MAVRPTGPRQGKMATAVARVALIGWFAGPVLDAPDHEAFSDESHTPGLDVSRQALTASTVNSDEEILENHLLQPRATESARKVFEETPGEDETELPEPAPAVQGLSDSEVPPLKRQMYRRDI